MKTNKQINEETISGYRSEYSETNFWSKIIGSAGKAGRRVVNMSLELYYAFKSGNMSAGDKAIVLAALGYLVCPFDFVPDMIPVLGFTDDLGALKIAYDKVSGSVTDEVKELARRKCEDIFG